MYINFNLRNKIPPKKCNPLNLYLPTHEKFASPYTSPNLAHNLLSDWLWAYSSVGERGHPWLTPMSVITSSCLSHLFELLCILWCTWMLQHVVDEVIHLIARDMPKGCHMGLYQKFFWNQQNKNRDTDLQMLLGRSKYAMWGHGPKWMYLPWNLLVLLLWRLSIPLIN
jgi:hypothetical protein